jgi:23S rRNA (guanine745-N1)-methyltransferase
VQSRVRALLVCPVCRAGLDEVGPTLRCADGHVFDIARQGYVNLAAATGRPPVNADAPGSVTARTDFLSAGHFAPLAGDLADRAAVAAGAAAGPAVLDAGAGTGYYLAAVLAALPGAVGLAVDSSPAALRRAARAHPRAGAVGWDLRLPLPIRDGAVDVLLNVFAPRNAAEYARVLRPTGVLLVVTPGPRHLAELVGPLGLIGVDADKSARLAATLDPYFEVVDAQDVEFGLTLRRDEASALVRMSPSAHHVTENQLAAGLAALPEPLTATASVTLGAYRVAG